jgi:hypothetical protein
VDAARWDAAVRTRLLPILPGDWQAASGTVIRGRVGWTAQLIQPQPPEHQSPAFHVEVLVQLMASPDPFTHTCALLLGRRSFPEPDSVAGYPPVMAEIGRLVVTEAVPFFDRYGGVDGYLTHLREREADGVSRGLSSPDMNVAEQLVYAHLIRGDRTAAAAAAELAELSGAENSARRRPIAWVEEGLQRVRRVMAASPGEALAILAANAAESAAVLALPEPELQLG